MVGFLRDGPIAFIVLSISLAALTSLLGITIGLGRLSLGNTQLSQYLRRLVWWLPVAPSLVSVFVLARIVVAGLSGHQSSLCLVLEQLVIVGLAAVVFAFVCVTIVYVVAFRKGYFYPRKARTDSLLQDILNRQKGPEIEVLLQQISALRQGEITKGNPFQASNWRRPS